MKTRITAVMIVAMLLSVPTLRANAGEQLTLDNEKSKINFVGSKPEGKHKGGFKKFTAKAEADWETPENSKIALVIDTTSLWSDNEKLTGHLKSPDFFNIRKFPKATFTSTVIEPQGEEKGIITGKFTLLGKTKELKVPVDIVHGEDKITLKSNFEINRMDYGMSYGAGKINDKVKVTLELALNRP